MKLKKSPSAQRGTGNVSEDRRKKKIIDSGKLSDQGRGFEIPPKLTNNPRISLKGKQTSKTKMTNLQQKVQRTSNLKVNLVYTDTVQSVHSDFFHLKYKTREFIFFFSKAVDKLKYDL